MRDTISCYLCLETARIAVTARDADSGEWFSLYRCGLCDLAVVPLPEAGVSDYYRTAYYGQRKSFTESLINYSRMRKIRRLVPPGAAVLDVGCGNGSLLIRLLRGGYEARGTEIAPEGHLLPGVESRICRKELPECAFPEKSFSLVTLWHSLEHFENPLLYLEEARRILAPGGKLMIEVPNIVSWQARIFGRFWFHLDVPRHLFHFSPKSLAHLLKKAGFLVLRTEHASLVYGPFGYLQSFYNVITPDNFLFNLLNGKAPLLSKPAHWWYVFIIIVTAIPVGLFALIFSGIEILARCGGVITVTAEKTVYGE